MEADLLVAAVALVERVVEDAKGERERLVCTKVLSSLEGAVVGRVIDHEYLDGVVVSESRRDPHQDVLDRPLGVVRDDEDQQARFHRV